MITVIDYGAGNIFSLTNALKSLGFEFRITDSGFTGAEKIILPGVGHFSSMMRSLEDRELVESIKNATATGVPFLGICLGMQALFESSEEAPGIPGLSLLNGKVVRLPETSRVPHMGWNEVSFTDGSKDWFYFANSFVVSESQDIWGKADHDGEFVAAVKHENLTGMQFHPEKSGQAGLDLLEKWCRNAS